MELYRDAINGDENIDRQDSAFKALVNFYRAFNSGNMELTQASWLQTEEASMSNPLGGVKRGWGEIYQVYKKIYCGSAKVYVEFYDFSLHEFQETFIAVGKERGSLTINGKQISLAIRTSRVFTFRENSWKQIHHHGSMDDPLLLSQYQQLLAH